MFDRRQVSLLRELNFQGNAGAINISHLRSEPDRRAKARPDSED
jgi:hypothetical protein